MILFVASVWAGWSAQTWHAPLAFAAIAAVLTFLVLLNPSPGAMPIPASAWPQVIGETLVKQIAIAYAGWGIGLGAKRLSGRKDA